MCGDRGTQILSPSVKPPTTNIARGFGAWRKVRLILWKLLWLCLQAKDAERLYWWRKLSFRSEQLLTLLDSLRFTAAETLTQRKPGNIFITSLLFFFLLFEFLYPAAKQWRQKKRRICRTNYSSYKLSAFVKRERKQKEKKASSSKWAH